mgnify:CR=1 FL=1
MATQSIASKLAALKKQQIALEKKQKAKGKTYQQFGYKIEFIEYPLKIPNINYRAFAKYSSSNQCKKYPNY